MTKGLTFWFWWCFWSILKANPSNWHPACGTSAHGMNANAWTHVVLNETATRKRQRERERERECVCNSHQSTFPCFVAPDLPHLITTHRGVCWLQRLAVSESARTSLWCNRFSVILVSIAVDTKDGALRLTNLHLPMPSSSNVVVHVGSTPLFVVSSSQKRGCTRRRNWDGLPILGPRRCFPVQDLKMWTGKLRCVPDWTASICQWPSGYAQWSSTPDVLDFNNRFVFDSRFIPRAPLHICQSPDDWRVVPQWRPWCLVDVCSLILIHLYDMNICNFFDVFDAQGPTLQPFIWLRTWRFIKSTPQAPLVSSTLDESQQGLLQISWAHRINAYLTRIHGQRRSTGSCSRPLDLFQSVREPLPVLCTPWPKPRSVETHPYGFHIRRVGSVQSRQP